MSLSIFTLRFADGAEKRLEFCQCGIKTDIHKQPQDQRLQPTSLQVPNMMTAKHSGATTSNTVWSSFCTTQLLGGAVDFRFTPNRCMHSLCVAYYLWYSSEG